MEKLKRAVFDLWLSNMKYQDIMKKYKLTSSKLNLIILEGLEENKDSLLQKYHHAIVLDKVKLYWLKYRKYIVRVVIILSVVSVIAAASMLFSKVVLRRGSFEYIGTERLK